MIYDKNIFTLLTICFLSMSLLLSCSDDDNTADTVCVSFNERQCQTDPWVSELEFDTSLTTSQKVDALETYLQMEGIDVEEITITENYDMAVCLACDVCPTGLRYFATVATRDTTTINELSFLDMIIEDTCNN